MNTEVSQAFENVKEYIITDEELENYNGWGKFIYICNALRDQDAPIECIYIIGAHIDDAKSYEAYLEKKGMDTTNMQAKRIELLDKLIKKYSL